MELHPDEQWFAIHVRTQCEQVVATALRQKGYQVYLPFRNERRTWAHGVRELKTPVFPGYLFSRFDPMRRLPVLTVPGVRQIIGAGKVPIPLPDTEIESLRKVIESDRRLQTFNCFPADSEVEIIDGPLRGARGTVLEQEGIRYLVVSIRLLQRSLAVRIEPEWVELVEKPSVHKRPMVPLMHLQPAAAPVITALRQR